MSDLQMFEHGFFTDEVIYVFASCDDGNEVKTYEPRTGIKHKFTLSEFKALFKPSCLRCGKVLGSDRVHFLCGSCNKRISKATNND